MSTIEQTRTDQQTATRPPTPVAGPNPTAAVRPLPIIDRRQSARTSMIFRALLGSAACLALVGVVAEANRQAEATSVDAPPPAVFIQTD